MQAINDNVLLVRTWRQDKNGFDPHEILLKQETISRLLTLVIYSWLHGISFENKGIALLILKNTEKEQEQQQLSNSEDRYYYLVRS